MNIWTTREMAAAVGISPRRLLDIAQERGVQAVRIIGRSKLWDPKDRKRLMPGKHGRPKQRAAGPVYDMMGDFDP